MAAEWPIVVVEFPEKTVSDATLRVALAYVESLLTDAARTRERIFVINELTFVREGFPSAQRKTTSEWMKRTAALARASSVGGANVTPSALLRGLLAALFLLQPSPTPNFFVASRREAMLKGIQLLEKEGARLPPHLVAYRDQALVRRAG